MSLSRRNFTKIALSAVAVVAVTGCGAPKVITPDMRMQSYRVSNGVGDAVALGKPSYWVDYKKDTIHLANGDNIMDEDGYFIGATEIKGELFYAISRESDDHMLLKDIDGKIIKDFGHSEFAMAFGLGDAFYVGTTTKTDARLYSNVLSKVYKFDGTKAKLHQKQVVYNSSSELGAGTVLNYNSKYNRSYITDFFTGKVNQIKPSLVPVGGYKFWGKKEGYKYEYIAGTVESVIVYSYNYEYYDKKDSKQYKLILEAQNVATGKSIILSDNSKEKFQFLSNKKDVVFKQGNKEINLATFGAVKTDSSFTVIISKDGFRNLGGGYTESPQNEYSQRDLIGNKKRQRHMFNY